MIFNDVDSLMRWQTKLLPDGYTKLNWIGTTGAQFINTGLYIDGGTPFMVNFRITSTARPRGDSSQGVFGARDGTSGYGITYQYSSSNFRVILYTNETIGLLNQSDSYNGVDMKLEVKSNGDIYLDDEYLRTATLNSWTSNKYAYLGKINGTSYTFNGFRIYEFETTGCHLIPAMRDSDSVVGMYDIVQDVFRTNQGSGTFTYG